MKKHLLLLSAVFLLMPGNTFSQTVYVNQTGTSYHTKACKFYTENFEAIQLWQAKGPYGKKPCPKCKPPTEESKSAPKKTKKPKPRPAPDPAPVKEKK